MLTQACRITRDAILRCRTAYPVLDFDLRRSLIALGLQRRAYRGYRSCRSGQRVRRRRLPSTCLISAHQPTGEIPTIIGNR